MQCPGCSFQLTAETISGQVVDACANCEGHFASHRALHAILLAQETRQQGAEYSRPSPLSESVRYRKCPTCSEPMQRKNFAEASGVVLDICPEHGLWFDRGELSTIMGFAATGAWQHAKHDASERFKAKRHLDAFMQEIKIGAPHHGSALSGAGDLARLIPLDFPTAGKGKRQ